MKDQTDNPKKLGPWGALAALAVMAAILLGFVWGLVAIIANA